MIHLVCLLGLGCPTRAPVAHLAPGDCGTTATAAVRRQGIRDVGACRQTPYGPPGDRLTLVQVEHGEEQDCESGCISERAALILYRGRVTAVAPAQVGLESPYEYVKDYLHGELEARGVPIREVPRGTPHHFLQVPELHWCANLAENLTLHPDGDGFAWTLRVPETRCRARAHLSRLPDPGYDVVIEGAIRIPIRGTGPPRPVHDAMTLKVEPTSPADPAR
ncbi:MAG: hypothetical protein AAF602_28780 [Myxococcota bacterium]